MQTGQILAGRYRVIRSLGRGGMALVFSATDEQLSRRVALKILPPELSDDQAATDRILREARAIGALNHPNIVSVFDVIEEPGTVGIVMEEVSGPSLQQLLDRGRLELSTIARVMEEVCAGVAEAHAQGIIHRDIKPSNVLLSAEGVAKVADFGVAAILDEAQATTTIRGSIPYVAPEQARGQPADSRSDVYGLGCMFYELVVGQVPFQGSAMEVLDQHLHAPPPLPTQQRTGLPVGVDAVVAGALAKDPAQRISDAAELAARITAFDIAGAGALRHDATAVLPAAAVLDGSAPTVAVASLQSRFPNDHGTTSWLTPARRLAALVGLILAVLALVAFADPDGAPADGPSEPPPTTPTPAPTQPASSEDDKNRDDDKDDKDDKDHKDDKGGGNGRGNGGD